MNFIFRGIAAAAILSAMPAAHAQQGWHAKPVRVIIANGPGSSPDLVARLMSERLGRTSKQQFTRQPGHGRDAQSWFSSPGFDPNGRSQAEKQSLPGIDRRRILS